MRKILIMVALSTLIPVFASADDDDERERGTQIRGVVATSTIPTLPVGDSFKATWRPALSTACELKNRTTGVKDRGLSISGTDVVSPSDSVACRISLVRYVTIEVNFSNHVITTNCGAAGIDQACIALFDNANVLQSKALVNLTSVEAGVSS